MRHQTIRAALDDIARGDKHVKVAVRQVGYPAPRNREPGFAALLEIIVGQQVSAHAAAAIRSRLAEAVHPLTPTTFLAIDDETLRAVGLSRRKIDYGRGLAEAMAAGQLAQDYLDTLDDEAAIAEITAINGLGRWSAEIYLLFAMGRADIWPADDLAIREALRRLKGLDERPDRATSEKLIEHWRPWRGIGALFLWHYYKGAP